MGCLFTLSSSIDVSLLLLLLLSFSKFFSDSMLSKIIFYMQQTRKLTSENGKILRLQRKKMIRSATVLLKYFY